MMRETMHRGAARGCRCSCTCKEWRQDERSSRPQNACLGPRKDPGRQIKPRRGRARVAVTLLLRKRNDKISRFNLSIVGGEESHIHVNDRDREAALAVFHTTTTHTRVYHFGRRVTETERSRLEFHCAAGWEFLRLVERYPRRRSILN